MEQNLNPVTSISGKDRVRIMNILLRVKFQVMAIQLTKKELSIGIFF